MLTVSKLEVLNLSDDSNTVRIHGEVGDTVDLGAGTWSRIETKLIGGDVFHVYRQGAANVEVAVDATVVGTIVLAADFNDDDAVNALDANILSQYWLTGGVTAAEGDFNGDLKVDALDANILSLNWLLEPATSAEGDANGDGVVNALDANALSLHWLDGSATKAEGDANGDGVVNALDANVLSGSWLAALPSTAVEEVAEGVEEAGVSEKVLAAEEFLLDEDLIAELAAVVARGFGRFDGEAAWEDGDVNGDGRVDGLDINWLWSRARLGGRR